MTKASTQTRLRSCAVCVQSGKILLIKMQDPASGNSFWVPPGGAIESGETPLQTAVRETLEETGYHVHAVEGAALMKAYHFPWAGNIVECHTHFIGAKLKKDIPDTASDPEHILEKAWIPLGDVPAKLAHHPSIRDAVLHVIHILRDLNI